MLARREQPVVQAPQTPEPKLFLLALQTNLAADARVRDQDVAQVPQTPELTERIQKRKDLSLEKLFRYKQQAMGRVLNKAKLAGSLLSDEDFYDIGKGPQLKLREGLRAVDLRIDDPAVSSDLIQTGSLVDVIFTTSNPDDGSKLTLRLVSGLEVLSPPVSEGGLPNSVASVAKKSYIRLAVTPEEANRLAQAQQMDGTISLSLCSVPGKGDGTQMDAKKIDALMSRGDFPVDERTLLRLQPRPSPEPAGKDRRRANSRRQDRLRGLHGGQRAADRGADAGEILACQRKGQAAVPQLQEEKGRRVEPDPGPNSKSDTRAASHLIRQCSFATNVVGWDQTA